MFKALSDLRLAAQVTTIAADPDVFDQATIALVERVKFAVNGLAAKQVLWQQHVRAVRKAYR